MDRLEKLGLVIALLWAFGYVVGYYHAPRPDPVPVFGEGYLLGLSNGLHCANMMIDGTNAQAVSVIGAQRWYADLEVFKARGR